MISIWRVGPQAIANVPNLAGPCSKNHHGLVQVVSVTLKLEISIQEVASASWKAPARHPGFLVLRS
jgi:hypothetical protein